MGSFTQLLLSCGLVLVYLLGSFPGFQYFHASLILIGIIAVFDLRLELLSSVTPLDGCWLTDGTRSQSKSPPQMLKILTHFTNRDVVTPLIIMHFIMFFQQIGGLNAGTAYSGLIFKEAGMKICGATATYTVEGTEVFFMIYSITVYCGPFPLKESVDHQWNWDASWDRTAGNTVLPHPSISLYISRK